MTKKYKFATVVVALLLAAGFGAPARAQTDGGSESIAAVVNSDAITASELAARTKLMVVSAGLPDTAEVRGKLRPQVINSLIEERLMMQEAANEKLTVTQPEIDQGFADLSHQNGMTPEQFQAVLAHGGIPVKTLDNQIEAQVAWSKVVQNKLRPQIVISDDMIDSELARMQADIGKTQYLAADIFLPVTSPSDEAGVRQLADKLVNEMTVNHAPFQRVASQFSQAPGASKGGDLGWVQQGQLEPALDRALAQMKEGELSPPIRTAAGYHILFLRKKTDVTQESMPSRDDVLEKLGVAALDRAQRRFLQELKAKAYIDRRG